MRTLIFLVLAMALLPLIALKAFAVEIDPGMPLLELDTSSDAVLELEINESIVLPSVRKLTGVTFQQGRIRAHIKPDGGVVVLSSGVNSALSNCSITFGVEKRGAFILPKGKFMVIKRLRNYPHFKIGPNSANLAAISCQPALVAGRFDFDSVRVADVTEAFGGKIKLNLVTAAATR